jgi:hypothetical protein
MPTLEAHFGYSASVLLSEDESLLREQRKKAPASSEEPTGAEWVADQLRELLVAVGWVAEGEAISEEQNEFLIANIHLLKAHFQGGKNS